MTDTTHFKPVFAVLETNLAAWTCFYYDQENITLGTLSPLHLSHLGHNPMKIILMPASPLICLHSQTCKHSRTILAINHPNLMVPLLNHGHLLPPCRTPQPSPQVKPHSARFHKKLSIRLHKKNPFSAGMLMSLSLKFPPDCNIPNTR